MMLGQSKISCFADEIDTDLEKQIALLKELGISYIEFRSANDKGIADYTKEEAENVKSLLDKEGLHVSAIGSPIGKIKITDDFEPHFELLKHVGELAAIFNTPYIRMFSFFMPEHEDPKNYRDEVFRRMDRMVNYAAGKGLILLHENEKDIYGDMADRCLDLMENFYGDSFRCTFDFANFVQCGQNTKEAYEMLKNYITYVHIKDAMAVDGEVVPAGQGDGQLAEILKNLDSTGYRGFLSLEPHLADFAGLKNLEKSAKERGRSDGETAFRIAYEALQKLLAQ